MNRFVNQVVSAILTATGLCAGTHAAEPASNITAPEGFRVTLFADDELAHDVFSLTTNARGEVVVSGPGYVRILVDQDNDGQADIYRTFAPSPATGAQGLYFDGNDLLCTGDGGLLRYRDDDGDGRADGPPEKLLSLKTGGEHFAHAIEQGPDGWWYLLLGNLAGIDRNDVSMASSPVADPAAGVLMRISPDYSQTEVVADGFRNPYDFAFLSDGSAFTFDSDGERDVSLPWYRPTRVFQIIPGAHAGWITRSWKHPDYYPDMPNTSASCGRGSPTGVVAYRHNRFPAPYHDALFILDWTFGRVFSVNFTANGSRLTGHVETFMTARGQFGFAPTDIAVTPQGDLMISVGGRGTRGGVYRVRYLGNDRATVTADRPRDRLGQCLAAPQPLASWSRARWTPAALALGKEPLVAAAVDPGRNVAERVRAIEIVTQLFDGLGPRSLQALCQDQSAVVRARAAWALGRQRWDFAEVEIAKRLIDDADPRVVRHALEAVVRHTSSPGIVTLFPHVAERLDAADPLVWQTAWKLVARLNSQQQLEFAQSLAAASPRCRIAYALAITDGSDEPNLPAFELACDVLQTTTDPQLRLHTIRAAQTALGDLRGHKDLPEVYDGYANQHDLKSAVPDVETLVELFPTGDHDTDVELARLIAMLGPESLVMAEKLGAMLTDASHPVADLHYLISLSRLPVSYSGQLRKRIAAALVNLESKLRERGLQQDRNWDLRVEEMVRQLFAHDVLLARTIIEQPQFGLPGHVMLTRGMAPELQAQAAQRVAQRLAANEDTRWTNDVVYLLIQSGSPEHRELVRAQFDDFALRGAVITALAPDPDAEDRAKFLTGLQSPDFSVMQASVRALEQLPASTAAEEQLVLLEVIRRLGADRQERSMRDRVMRILQRNMGRSFGYQFGIRTSAPQNPVINRWTEYLTSRFPDAAAQRLRRSEDQLAELLSRLARVDWNEGRSDRGETLFQRQACDSCHNARSAVGPDLSGIGARFSRSDLFTAIVYPNKDVSPRYNTTLIETVRGKVLSGVVIYESVDGVTLLDSTNRTIRVNAEEIDARHELSTSVMPVGLLEGLQPQDLADLYAYLQSL